MTLDWSQALVISGTSLANAVWQDRLINPATAFFSGWMATRKRRKAGSDKGFILSDHVDWPSLISSVRATGASEIWVTHGFTHPVVRYLREIGLDASEMATSWESEESQDSSEDSANPGVQE